jgi:hypothetical protein
MNNSKNKQRGAPGPKIGKLLPPIPLDFETVVRALGKTAPPPKQKSAKKKGE